MLRSCWFALALVVILGCTGHRSPTASSSSETDSTTDTPQQQDESGCVSDEAPPAPIDLSGYERACKTDADCILVHAQPCSKCGCAEDSIAASEQQRFQQAIAAVKCRPCDFGYDIECADCTEPAFGCDAGQCKTKP